jgi:hypothetical protein
MSPLALLALLLTSAHAADPVLHAGDGEAAVAKVAEDTGRAPEELAAATLPDLLGGSAPLLIGGGALRTCQREPVTAEAFQQALSTAESSMAFMEYGQALSELEGAATLLGCLNTPADPTSASRLHYLRGLSFYFAEEPEAARAAWVQAHRFNPSLPWDDNFPPDGQTVFEAARALVDADEPTTLAIVPTPADGTLWLDGRQVKLDAGALSIPGGKHLAQFGTDGVTTVQLQLAPGSSNTLVIPDALEPDAVAWVADETLRSFLSSALEVALDTGAQVYAVHEGVTWTGTAGGTTWESLEPLPPPTPEPAEELPPKPRRKKTRWIFASGTAVAVVASLTAVAMYASAQGAHERAEEAPSMDIYKDEEEMYLRSRNGYRVSSWIAVGGVGVAVVGIAVPIGRYRSSVPRARLGATSPPVDPFASRSAGEWVANTELIEP